MLQPESVIRACLDFLFRRMDFVWLLMSNSELLRIKNKQKAPYKKTKDCKQLLKLYI